MAKSGLYDDIKADAAKDIRKSRGLYEDILREEAARTAPKRGKDDAGGPTATPQTKAHVVPRKVQGLDTINALSRLDTPTKNAPAFKPASKVLAERRAQELKARIEAAKTAPKQGKDSQDALPARKVVRPMRAGEAKPDEAARKVLLRATEQVMKGSPKAVLSPKLTATQKQAIERHAANEARKYALAHPGVSPTEMRKVAQNLEDQAFAFVAQGFVNKGTPLDKINAEAWRQRPDLSFLTSLLAGTVTLPVRATANAFALASGEDVKEAAKETAIDALPLIGKGAGAAGKALARGAEAQALERTALGPVANVVRNRAVGRALSGAQLKPISSVSTKAVDNATKAQSGVDKAREVRPAKSGANAPLAVKRVEPPAKPKPGPVVEPDLTFDPVTRTYRPVQPPQATPNTQSLKPAEKMTADEYVSSKWEAKVKADIAEMRHLAASSNKSDKRKIGFAIRQAELNLKQGVPPPAVVEGLKSEHAAILQQRVGKAPKTVKPKAPAVARPVATEPVAITPTVQPATRRVKVGENAYALTGERLDAYNAAEASYKQRLASINERTPNTPEGKEWAASQKKALQMAYSAERRKIVGAMTQKERQAAETQANKIVPGTQVALEDGTEGVAKSNAFGKVTVDLPDGTRRVVERGLVSPATVKPVAPPSEPVVLTPEAPVQLRAVEQVAEPVITPAMPGGVDVSDVDPLTGLRMADVQMHADRYGIALPTRQEMRRTWQQTQSDALANREAIERSLKGVVLEPNPSLTSEERFIGQIKLRELNARVQETTKALNEARTEGEREAAKLLLDDLFKQSEGLSRTLWRSNSNKGRELAFLRSQIPDDFDDAALLVKAERLSGGNITNGTRARIIEIADKGKKARMTLEEKMKRDAAKALERIKKMGLDEVNLRDLEDCL